jgi:cell wall-associated NlpC family hydrolase
MTEQEQREAVVTAARSFVGTPYHHEARIKGVGVDCATLLELAYVEAGVLPPMNATAYSSQWHLHHDEPLYENAVKDQGAKQVETPGIGDIILYFQGRQFAHGAIISSVCPLRIIHAYAASRGVVEGDETEFGVLSGVKKKFFSTW